MAEKIPDRQETIGTDERQDLVGRDEEGNRVNESEQTEDNETGQPVAAAVGQDALPGFQFHPKKIVAEARNRFNNGQCRDEVRPLHASTSGSLTLTRFVGLGSAS